MKTPRRSFVVELRSGRRQPKAGTNSIWGDTDLKAVTREVEQKVPHLFMSHDAPGAPGSGEAMPADPINAGAADKAADAVEIVRQAIPSSDGEGEMPKQTEADRPAAAEAVALVQESEPVSRSRPAPRGTARKHVRRPVQKSNSKPVHRNSMAQTTAAGEPISLEDLASLDADNKRLKRLLAEQLRSQNVQLRKMLERFAIA
jgi:hypothetical protein